MHKAFWAMGVIMDAKGAYVPGLVDGHIQGACLLRESISKVEQQLQQQEGQVDLQGLG